MISIKTILVPVDASPASGCALAYARTLADACGASLHLLHVVAHPLGAPQSSASELFAALVEPADRERRQSVARCSVGTPAVEIVRYAQANGVDLIVMGTHSHGPTNQMFTGSIAEHVVRRAPCPVLTVKGPATAEEEPLGHVAATVAGA